MSDLRALSREALAAKLEAHAGKLFVPDGVHVERPTPPEACREAARRLRATCQTCRWQRHDDPVEGLGHLSCAPFCGNGLSPSYQSHTPIDYCCSLWEAREERSE